MGKDDIVRALKKIPGGNLKVIVGDWNQIVTDVEVIDGVVVINLENDPDP